MPSTSNPDYFSSEAAMSGEISRFSLLPEDCIADIFSFTSPKDACRAAAVSLGFKSAVESDTVWDRFLPSDYHEIVSESTSPVVYSTKKQLYLLLCDSPLLLRGDKLSFRLSRTSGKKCYTLCARELRIIWGDNPIYWTWTSLPDSRFAEVAELQSVCWLEIGATLQAQMLSPNTNYAAFLVFKLSENHHGLDCSSKTWVKFVRENGTEFEEMDTRSVYIVQPTRQRVHRRRLVSPPAINTDDRLSRSRTDGWLEIELGEFFIYEGDNYDIQIKLCEIERLNWKKGLIVEGIELRPKEAF